jgi:hypothetical protein
VVTAEPSRLRWPRRLIQVALGLLVCGLIVGGVVAVGNVARQSLGPQDRYAVPFAQIECPVPSGEGKAQFLEEVQYIGSFPDTLNVLDPALPEKLREAFARHKRVQKVIRVQVLTPKRIVVELAFRS